MASADMDTRIRGYDRGGAGMKAILSCPTRSGIHLVIVTPDSIGGLCLRLSWIPAFAGMTEGGGYDRGSAGMAVLLSCPRMRASITRLRHARACGHPSPTCVMPAHAGIHHPLASCPRMQASITHLRHARACGYPSPSVVHFDLMMLQLNHSGASQDFQQDSDAFAGDTLNQPFNTAQSRVFEAHGLAGLEVAEFL